MWKDDEAVPGTMYKFTREDSFTLWMTESSPQILHLCGPPGSGVTMLSSLVITFLEALPWECETIHIKYCFNRHATPSDQVTSLFASLIHQLLLIKPSLFRYIDSLCSWLMDQSILSQETLQILLDVLLTSHPGLKIFCIIVGFQDYDPLWYHWVEQFTRVGNSTRTSLKFLLAGEVPYDTSKFGMGSDSYHVIDLAEEKRAQWVVEWSVLVRFSRLSRNRPVWGRLKQDVARKVRNESTTYSLAMQKMDYLELPMTTTTVDTISNRLNNLPKGHWDIYADVFRRLRDKQLDWAISSLYWIAHALRPLKVSELAVASALHCPDIKSVKRLKNHISCDILGDLPHVVWSILKVDNDHIYPLDQMLHDHVTKSEDVDGKCAQREILLRCLDYIILIGDRYRGERQENKNNRIIFLYQHELHLMEYAVLFWPEHYKRIESDHQATKKVLGFLSNPSYLEEWFIHYRRIRSPVAVRKIEADDLLIGWRQVWVLTDRSKVT